MELMPFVESALICACLTRERKSTVEQAVLEGNAGHKQHGICIREDLTSIQSNTYLKKHSRH